MKWLDFTHKLYSSVNALVTPAQYTQKIFLPRAQ